MTLQALLSTLETNNVTVTIKTAVGDIITFTSGGYQGVESDILAREVESWSVNIGRRSVDVLLSRQAGVLTLSSDTVTLAAIDAEDTVTVTAATGAVSVSSSAETVATATIEGNTITVKEVGAGSATVIVTSAAEGDYDAVTKTIAVTCTE